MIHVEIGHRKSLLIDLVSWEVRECLTSELEDLDRSEDLDLSANIALRPTEGLFDFYNLDLHLWEVSINKNSFKEQLSQILKSSMVFWNYRIFLHKDVEAGVINLISDVLNESYIHFGGLLLVPKTYSAISEEDIGGIMLVKWESAEEQKLYRPKLLVTPEAMILAMEHNIYYASRNIIDIYKDRCVLKDTKQYNISKNKVQICRDCQYRNVCLDPRRVLQDESGAYYYEQTCAYDPYTGAWLEKGLNLGPEEI